MQSTNGQESGMSANWSNDAVMAKILLSLCGVESDAYTETILGGAILAIKVAYERGREAKSSVGVSGVGEMPERPCEVQPGDSQEAQTVEQAG
jgi:hypothetical protein